MKSFQENIVPSTNQNSKNVFLYSNENAKIKILFVGNSITRHEKKPDIGWDRDCGMAASSLDKDYVHQVIKLIKDRYDENVSFAIAQVADFERQFETLNFEEEYLSAKEFGADIIITFFGANVSKEYDITVNPTVTFGSCYEKLVDYLSNGSAKVYHSMGFYIRNRLDSEKEQVAKKRGETFIDISEIRMCDESHGLFNHPGDLGMKMIADKFFSFIENDLKRICEKR